MVRTSTEPISKAPDPRTVNERVLILAPTGRDGDLASAALTDARLPCSVCHGIEELCEEIERGAGAVMITEEALPAAAMGELRQVLDKQPPWSELPLIVFTSQPFAQ